MNCRVRFLLVSALLVVAVRTVVGQDIQVLPRPQVIEFPAGYEVIDGNGKVLKRIGGPSQATVQAYVDGNGTRWFMSDWSFNRWRQGKSVNWIRPRLERPPAAPAEPGVQVLDQMSRMQFPHGVEIFDNDGRFLKRDPAVREANVKAFRDIDGVRYWVSDWSWNRLRTEGIAPNWMRPLPAPGGGASDLADLMRPRPEPEIDPELARIHELADQVRRLMNRGRFEEALEKSHQVEAAYRAEGFAGELDEFFWWRRTRLNMHLGNWEEAARAVEECLRRVGEPFQMVSPRADYARILEELGKEREAGKQWEFVRRNFEDVSYYEEKEIRKAMIAFYLRRGNFAALETIPDTPDLQPRDPQDEVEQRRREMEEVWRSRSDGRSVNAVSLLEAAMYYRDQDALDRTRELLPIALSAFGAQPWDAFPWVPRWTRLMVETGAASGVFGSPLEKDCLAPADRARGAPP